MKKDLLVVMDKYFKHVKYDRRLYNDLRAFRLAWSQKSPEYVEFLGGHLMGVHPIRFSSADEDSVFIDIFNIDQNELKIDIHKLEDINPAWKVSSNPFYLTMVYTMHRFYKDNKIGSALEDAIRECYYIFAYKAIGSIVTHYLSIQ